MTQKQPIHHLPTMTHAAYFKIAQKVSPTSIPVLVYGESGVGKDVLARHIHTTSARKGDYVPINAAGLSRELAASELFGHTQGAFTGAEHEKAGAFHKADKGTLFLDEIAELSLATQAELLRTLESGKVRKVGDSQEEQVDVRIISATHQNLAHMVEQKTFRKDLYHRLCVLPITIPPLRQRKSDLQYLTQMFLRDFSPQHHLSQNALSKILHYAWPGNIRELKNTLVRSVLMATTDQLDAKDIKLIGTVNPSNNSWEQLITPFIFATYAQTNGNVAQTAKELGLRRSVIYKHIHAKNKNLF
ncbi:MAG: sigma-54 dependent transcriptional regulator [Myxococcota bacterium]|nr:sigma-54 dependent transcriptional regulator [Myxococcota bacterium]